MLKLTFKLINPILTLILRSPLHGLISKKLMLVEFTGRRSGRKTSTPVNYFRESDYTLRTFTESDRQWWRNVIGGQPFRLRIEGKSYEASAEVVNLQPDEMDKLLVATYQGMSLNDIRRMIPKAHLIRFTLSN